MQKQIEQLDCRDSILCATQEAIKSIDKELFSLHDLETQKTLKKYGFNVTSMIQDLNEFKEDIFQLEKLHHLRVEAFEEKLQENGELSEMNSDEMNNDKIISKKIAKFIHDNIGLERELFREKAEMFVSETITTNHDYYINKLNDSIEKIRNSNHKYKNHYLTRFSDMIKIIECFKNPPS
jgi:dGTP triphosphohydrolase